MSYIIGELSKFIGLIGGIVGIIGGSLGIWAWISTRRRENAMWQIYFNMLPDLQEGKTWDPKKPNEIKLAVQLVEKGILKRSPISGYLLPDLPLFSWTHS